MFINAIQLFLNFPFKCCMTAQLLFMKSKYCQINHKCNNNKSK